MKNLIFRILNLTVGRIVRLFQSMLISHNPPQGVFHLINQHAWQDSAQYALDNFSGAMQFGTRPELWRYCLNRIPQLQTGGGSLLSSAFGKESRSTFLQKVAPKPGYLDLTLLKA
jgi:hypothetical protein